MSDTFREAIHSAGLEPPARIEPGRFHRFPGAGKRKGNTAGWCRLFPDGRGGVFGDWSTGLHQTWQAEHDRPFTDQEREDFRRLVEEARRQAEELRQGERAAAAAKARKRLELAPAADSGHPYLERKGIGTHGARQDGGLLLIPVIDEAGELSALQTIDQDGAKLFWPAGCSTAGASFQIGKPPAPGEPVLIAEGFATAAAIHESTGHLAIVAFCAGNLERAARTIQALHPGHPVIVCADDDTGTEGNPGITAATAAARAIGGKLAVPGMGRRADFWDLRAEGGPEAVRAALAAAMDIPADQDHQERAEPEEWEPPVDLDTPDLPGFTAADFPPTLWAMIEGIAKATETPLELPAMGVLAVAATACQRRLKIELDPGYTEPLNLWTLTALPPGSRKSAVQRLAIAPLQSWEIERGQAMAPEIKEAEAARAAGALRIRELQKRYAKEQDEGKRSTLLEEITCAEAALPEIPVRPKAFRQDVTPEKAGALLATYGEKIGIFSAEGGIFDILAGRYSGGVPNMDVFLQAHAGDQVRVDRGSRPPVDLQEPALSMGLSIQPSVLHEMAGKAAFRGRGLIGRFLFAVPADIVGRRTLETVPVSASVRAGYDQAIMALLDLPEQRNMLNGELFAIQLTPEAHADWKAFAREVETGMAEGGPLESLRDWAGKAAGAAGRIAGVFHCIEHAGRLFQADPDDLFPPTPDRYPLTSATMRTALNLARKLLAHAVFVYGIMGEDEGIWAARRILRWIRSTNAEGFSVNECYRALRGTFPKRADLDPGLLTLAERNYIRRERPPADRKPGRPSERYTVNPATWTRQEGF